MNLTISNFNEPKLLLEMQITLFDTDELLTIGLFEIILPNNTIAYISNTKEWTCLEDFDIGDNVWLPDIWAIHTTFDEFFNSLDEDRKHYDLFQRNIIHAIFYFEPIYISATIKEIVEMLINIILKESNLLIDVEELEFINIWKSKMD